jgi:hypothetical protein
MLDVHPPHAPTHTWRDFLIHIATIVVGLLIAIGLEQTVEVIHRNYELREVREALSREREANLHSMQDNQKIWIVTFSLLRDDLATLKYVQDHPDAKQPDLPFPITFSSSPFQWSHAEWDAAEQSGVIRNMPLQESNRYQIFYELLQRLNRDQTEIEWDATNDANRFRSLDPDPTHLGKEQLQDEIRLAQIAYEKHIQLGYEMALLNSTNPDIPQIVTYQAVSRLQPWEHEISGAAISATYDRIEREVTTPAGP